NGDANLQARIHSMNLGEFRAGFHGDLSGTLQLETRARAGSISLATSLAGSSIVWGSFRADELGVEGAFDGPLRSPRVALRVHGSGLDVSGTPIRSLTWNVQGGPRSYRVTGHTTRAEGSDLRSELALSIDERRYRLSGTARIPGPSNRLWNVAVSDAEFS